MSGTSADGIDAVVATLSGEGRSIKATVLGHSYRKFPISLRKRIIHCSTGGTTAEVCELNFVLGRQFANAALQAIHQARLKPADIDLVSSHGQTIHHLPKGKHPSTLQIGEPAVIAEITGLPVIADFRVRDLAAGGQGAPLVSFADWALFTHPSFPRIIQNIGGIANLTFLPPGAQLSEVWAFDTGPGNMVIDAFMSEISGGKIHFDRNGATAAKGRVSPQLLDHWMRHPFIRRQPPKTTGREEFGHRFAADALARARTLKLSSEDLLATCTAFTAETIALAYKRFIFPVLQGRTADLQIIVGGGGARNRTLQRMLQERVGCGTWFNHENFGIPDSAKEALAFAILGYQTLRGTPSNVPFATGAKHPAILGKIVLP